MLQVSALHNRIASIDAENASAMPTTLAALPAGISDYKSPFLVKFLSGVGGLTLGTVLGLTFAGIAPPLAIIGGLLPLTGCAGAITIAGNSYGDEGYFFLTLGGCAGGLLLTAAAAELTRSLVVREQDFGRVIATSAVGASVIGLSLIVVTPLLGVVLYDLSRVPPQREDSGSLLNFKDGVLSVSPMPSASASYQHSSMLYSVKLLQVQF